ncbi:DUF6355 family natural product biosynthesis protein [Saccharothrix sp. NPDC042600]|uniref:DUF6355 family natural product biosynthesis protein n=1 Tax=Saccharothrix TaxID=2071 RepID=UPI0033FE1DC7|nr:hypothetical protein GCM10017745_67660 [Saccharothrix mutabilis subsp. capreolus]
MTSTTARAATALATAISALVLTLNVNASATQARCGYHHVNPDHHNGAVALYNHCADSFILIRVDHSNGHSYHRCVEPWGSVPFYPNSGVTNAYYVRKSPNLLVDNAGHTICSLTQPPV